ncbi:MAG TPA: universal stress protein [Pilimelia sp.]|nr:universal stress protein [Pilimelia sp.]
MRPSIVVGLGGSGGWHALGWATNEAAATGGRLVLCHACRPDSALADRGPAPPIGLLEVVDLALARAVGSARTRLGGDRVTLRIQPGRPGHLLVQAAAGADLAVIGPPARRTPGGLGSTAHDVAAHAPCPVVVARPVDSAHGAPFAGHVVVGVDDSPAARAAVEFAFRYADTHRRPLAAVHVTADRREDYWFDETMLSTHFAAEPAGLELLATEVEPWMRKYPNVATKLAVYAGRPLPGLVRAAAGASLLVVGDHGHSAAVRAVLGTVSDGVLDAAPCPVAIVHDYERRGGQP